MKFLIALLITTSAHASFISLTDLTSCKSGGAHTVFTQKQFCVSEKGEECVELPDGQESHCNYLNPTDNIVDDLTKPIYSGRQDVESCQKEIEYTQVEQTVDDGLGGTTTVTVQEPTSNLPICADVLAAKICSVQGSEKYIDELYTQVYCTHITGYEQKIDGKKVVEDASLKAAYEVQKSQKDQLEGAMVQAAKAQNCGRSTMAYMLVRNAPKNLSTAQVKSLVSTYAAIKGLLESGSLVTAKEEIAAVVADGILVTEADKAALIAYIDTCKP